MPSSQIPSTSRASRSGTRAMRDPSPANPPVQAPAPSRPSALSPPPMYSAARPHSAPPQTDSTSSSARPSIPDVKLFFAPFAQYEDGVMAQIEDKFKASGRILPVTTTVARATHVVVDATAPAEVNAPFVARAGKAVEGRVPADGLTQKVVNLDWVLASTFAGSALPEAGYLVLPPVVVPPVVAAAAPPPPLEVADPAPPGPAHPIVVKVPAQLHRHDRGYESDCPYCGVRLIRGTNIPTVERGDYQKGYRRDTCKTVLTCEHCYDRWEHYMADWSALRPKNAEDEMEILAQTTYRMTLDGARRHDERWAFVLETPWWLGPGVGGAQRADGRRS